MTATPPPHDDTTTIACTLSQAERTAAERVYATAAQHYTATAKLDADDAVIDLHGDQTHLTAILADMTAREAGCCSWLTIESSPLPAHDGRRVRLALANPHPSADALEFAPTALREMLALLFPGAALSPVTT